MSERKKVAVFVFSVFALILLIMALYPQYKIYYQRSMGEAELARAEYNRRIKIVESEAHLQAASNYANADTLRAHGTARSNQIIGLSLSADYLSWLWISNIEKNKNTTVYVPSGSMGMPLLFNQNVQKP
jgi:hypothetical protein